MRPLAPVLVTASALFVLACDDGPGAGLAACLEPGQALVGEGPDRLAFVLTVSTDYQAGSYSVIDLDTRSVRRDLGVAHGDADARLVGGRLLVVNRLGRDNLQVLDPGDDFATVAQWTTGRGSNLQDVAETPGGALVVSRYAEAEMALLDPLCGTLEGTIDLGPFADEDGRPEMAAVQGTPDGRVLVACQRLVDLRSTGPSSVCVVGPDLGVSEEPLVGRNPFTPFVEDLSGGGYLLGVVGDTMTVEADQGVERIGLDGVSHGLLVTEEELGGSVSSLTTTPDGSGAWAIVIVPSDPDRQASLTRLVRFDLATGGSIETLAESTGFDLWAVAANDRGEVFVSDRRYDRPGVRVFDGVSGEEQTDAPIDVGLPPGRALLFLP